MGPFDTRGLQEQMVELRIRERERERDLNLQEGFGSPARRLLSILITLAAILLAIAGIVILIYH